MGSHNDELTVLVTGFGPFGDQQSVNPSWEIAKSLPSELPRSEHSPRVRIIIYPEPIRVSYRTVRTLVPTLWDEHRIDAAIHIGMAGPRPVYQLERRARRSEYRTPDVDGALPPDDDDDEDNDDDGHRLPAELRSELHLDDVLDRWRALSQADMDLRLSDDAGRFLCEFIYFTSLSELMRRRRRRNVVFLHVPCHATERYVTQGRDLALSLVRAVAQSLVAGGQPASKGGEARPLTSLDAVGENEVGTGS
ncbi:hypothetical protein XA68_14636 [Ophiocordyceps unilateralis]|uniref:Pyroglutamyl-peptidase I n=1 Tax=Ophiocordyceps unilateralis TaxID=268505 RepID=A0A2A9PA66_OPHUN|nr:hypothetical protein XA68_14636 [Ophiocordyceps unilateralis]